MLSNIFIFNIKNLLGLLVIQKKVAKFVLTVLATLPIRTASQGESFALITILKNTPPMPLSDAHLGGFLFLNLLIFFVKLF